MGKLTDFLKGLRRNGSEWEFTDLVHGPFLDNGGAVFNVKHRDFGARGDGVTDDTGAVQAALNAAAAFGGTVLLPPGVYHCGDLDLPGNHSLRGAPGSVIKAMPGRANPWISLTGDNILVEGVTFDGANAAQTARFDCVKASSSRTNITFRDCKFRDGRGSFLAFRDATYDTIRVENCKFTGLLRGGACIAFTSSSTADAFRNVFLTANRIDACAGYGINTYVPNPSFGTPPHGITTWPNSNFQITGNIITNLVPSPDYYAAIPIEIQCCYSGVVANNTCDGGTHGISVGATQWLTVTGNTVRNQSWYGIELGVGWHQSIVSNVIENCGWAISCPSNQKDLVIANNTINGTTAVSGTARTGYGVYLVGCEGVTISGNRFRDTMGSSILIGQANGLRATDVMIVDNAFRFTAPRLASGGYAAIAPTAVQLTNADRVTIRSNEVLLDAAAEVSDGSLNFTAAFNLTSGSVTAAIIENNRLIALTAAAAKHSAVRIQAGVTAPGLRVLRNAITNWQVGVHTSSDTASAISVIDNEVALCTTAYALGTNVTTALALAAVSSFHVYLSTASTAIAAFTTTTLVFNVGAWDNLGEYSGSTGAFTAQVAGTYVFEVGVYRNDSGTGRWSVSFYRTPFGGAAAEERRHTDTKSATTPHTVQVAAMIKLAAGDKIDVRTVFDVAGTVGGNPQLTWFSGYKLP